MNKKWAGFQRDYKQKAAEFDKALLKLKITDSGEPLVGVKDLSETKSLAIIFAETCLPYLRQPVAEVLVKAAEYFQKKGYVLKVESAYRSLSDQRQRFGRRYQEIKDSNPRMSHSAVLAKANTYTAGTPILAAHTAGAAVDVTLLDPLGNAVDFGVPYRYGDVESITDFPGISKEAKGNRRLLQEGMEIAGFVNYPFEYWHYSIGDVCAAYLKRQSTAIYGPVNFDPASGRQTAVPETMARQPFIRSG